MFRGHRDVVLVCKFHPDSHRLQLFSAGNDNEVRVWDLVNNACTAVFKVRSLGTDQRPRDRPAVMASTADSSDLCCLYRCAATRTAVSDNTPM